MTEYGAIKELSIEYPGEYHKQREAKDIAIRAIKENLEYRKLGTLEELREAKELSIVNCGRYAKYRDYDIINKWWVRKLTIEVGGNEIEFDSLEEAKSYIDDLYVV